MGLCPCSVLQQDCAQQGHCCMRVLSWHVAIALLLLQAASAFVGQHARSLGLSNRVALCASKPPLSSQEEQAQSQLTGAGSKDANKGLQIAVLAAVPVLWGTYTPSVKYMSAVQPPGLIFNAACYVISGFALWTSIAVAAASRKAT
eukprot:17345-Heterococcus_DN1.PRE.1